MLTALGRKQQAEARDGRSERRPQRPATSSRAASGVGNTKPNSRVVIATCTSSSEEPEHDGERVFENLRYWRRRSDKYKDERNRYRKERDRAREQVQELEQRLRVATARLWKVRQALNGTVELQDGVKRRRTHRGRRRNREYESQQGSGSTQ